MAHTAVSWPDLQQAAVDHGEEFYLLDLAAVGRNYIEWRDALRSAYADSDVAYSYKTNYTPAVCRAVSELGGFAEVVSGMELDLAKRLGVPGDRIVFNGPYKRLEEIEHVLLGRGLVYLDALYEIPMVEAVASRNPGRPLRIGLRCHVQLEGSSPSRFGFDVDGDDFREAIHRLVLVPGCRAVDLHAHYLPAQRRPEDFAAIASHLLRASRHVPASHRPEIIDVGGGFYSRMPAALSAQFGAAHWSACDYAAALGDVMRSEFPARPRPRLLIEPGLALVAEAMSLAARVVALKTIAGRRIALVASSRYSAQPTLSPRVLPATVVRPGAASGLSEANEPVDVVGYTCMEHDCLLPRFTERVAPGDWIVIHHAGAYTSVLRPSFIAPCPAILVVDGAGRITEVARRRDTPVDVFASFTMAERLTTR